MLNVGITGNIGSGKSWICRIFEAMGIPVFYGDQEAKALYYDSEIKQQVIAVFGSDVYDKDGNLDRKKMASIVFSDPKALFQINSIIHPALNKRYEEWMLQHQDKDYVLHESAIIFEHGLEKTMDFVINVSAPKLLRLKRVMDRDGLTEEEVKSRMKNQWTDEVKNEMANFVLINDGDDAVIDQVRLINKQLIEKNKLQ
ncbi:MAG: dephospho-CoA kinase [Bacteroidales bacterium]|nr:dephospho-CoA kinase [Bacteroidales bacterium]